MRSLYIKILASIVAIVALSSELSYAQYYSWGADAANLRWSSIRTEDTRIIYPDTVSGVARRALYYFDTIKKDLGFGYKYGPLNLPVVMHPENFSSNGMVMWLPKRIEFLTTPNIDGFSMMWTKQLVAHEFRHATQYNNLNRNVIRFLSYILGDQGSAVGLLLLPTSILEGDAVKFETSMTSFGRGLQPSFSMGYRAIGREMLSRRNIDRWFCGSYLEYTPDHYELGYQVVDYTYTKYGYNIWDKVAEFGTRRPYYIMTTSSALRKYYGTNQAKLIHESFGDLFDYWESLPERENSPEILSEIDTKEYTKYQFPIPYGESEVIAIKGNLSRSQHFISYDTESGEEERIAYVGSISTRPSIGGDRVWWSEYRYSKMYQQKLNSTLCYLDLEGVGKTRFVRGADKVLYPTPIDNDPSRLAYVEYMPNGVYSIIETELTRETPRRKSDLREVGRTPIVEPTEVHGLAWDDVTEGLYFIATDDSGMWLGALDKESDGGYRQLTQGAYITISDLRAGGGKLYFGSIESGYDELHCYDLLEGREYRLSQSEFGSFDPSPARDGVSYATTYDKYGYHLSSQLCDEIMEEVAPKNIPQNIVNPPDRIQWQLINLDTVVYTPEVERTSYEEYPSRKYNKGLKLFKLHSWMPVAFNPLNITTAEQFLDMTLGATVISQNLLSSAESYASYGYSLKEGSTVSGQINYSGLGVNLSVGGSWGGNQIIYTPYGNLSWSQNNYYAISGSATLPLLYNRGYRTRYLAVNTAWNYSNGLISDLSFVKGVDGYTYKLSPISTGLHKMSVGIGFSDSVRSATRQPMSPWGYSISGYYAFSPTERGFSDLVSTYAKVTTPGLGRYNSFSVAACYQTSVGDSSSSDNLFSSVSLLPRGGFSSYDVFNSNYASISLNYQFPVWYPEGGIGSIVYFRRVRINLGLDGARFENYWGEVERIYAYGGDLILDLNPLRMPEASTTSLKFSFYQPSEGSIAISMGVELPF